MNQLDNREPGLVDAALETANLSAGLIQVSAEAIPEIISILEE